MRPQRITVSGFAAFRDPTEIDLTDVELFALVGPTGAGKSSVIDAMVFALYGCVPRYDSENLVHPVITQGSLEARVRLDFTAAGADYSATRVVRRTRTGASTKEARLERCEPDGAGEVLADDAKSLTAAVTDLLGLDLEQFTKCVVLPQGAFATLLHDTKAKRQDLLVKLLDLGLYEQVAAAARAEVKQVGYRVESLDEQLLRSAHATDEAVGAADAHVGAVEAAIALIDAAGPELAAIEEECRAIDRELTADVEALEVLHGLAAPSGLADISERAAAATDAVERARLEEVATSQGVEDAEKVRAELPAEAEIREALADHRSLDEFQEKVDTGTRMVAELDERRPALARAVDAAAADASTAGDHVERTRLEHAAADLARHLHAGDDCPVCGNTVTEPPTVDAGALAAAERRLVAARDAERAAVQALAQHDTTAAEYRALLEDRTAARDAVAGRLRDRPAPDELEADLAAIVAAEAALVSARRADVAARRALTDARAAADDATGRLAGARVEFTAARDRLAGLGPPPAGDDVAGNWEVLLAWADTERRVRDERSAEARRRRAAVTERRSSHCRTLVEQVTGAGVAVPAPARSDVGALRDACLTEAASARTRREHLAAERDRMAELRVERTALDERRQVHDLLAEQLGARGFEAWLLDEALEILLEGASRWLEQLSSGRYAMTVDDKNQFAVIDHANADERRLAKTLSGGETFLASLALALALAERVGELASGGGRGLEAIFLDEGFGTLDPDTLDVVATAIEELGATGRMVGVVSHVRELAERVPVRFEITKDPGSSTVRRVEA